MTPQFLLLQIELNHDVEHTKKTSNLISKLSYLKVALDSMACVISAILFRVRLKYANKRKDANKRKH